VVIRFEFVFLSEEIKRREHSMGDADLYIGTGEPGNLDSFDTTLGWKEQDR
jgi:hypothetical protein